MVLNCHVKHSEYGNHHFLFQLDENLAQVNYHFCYSLRHNAKHAIANDFGEVKSFSGSKEGASRWLKSQPCYGFGELGYF
jgi:hypothetical protein